MQRIDFETKIRLHQLATDAKYGDDEAFAEIYKITKDVVRGIVVTRGIKQSDIDDVCSDIFLSLCKNIKKFDETQNFWAWFCRIIKSRIYDKMRKYYFKRKNTAIVDGEDKSIKVFCLDECEEFTRDETLLQFINHLDDKDEIEEIKSYCDNHLKGKQREVMLRTLNHELTVHIAAAMGITEHNVDANRHVAIKKLKVNRDKYAKVF